VVSDWAGCYGEGWTDICPESFAHPAKYSRALIRRIYEHAFAEGWLHAGETILDPFGGVALGGLDAMRLGLHWTGVELEERFVSLGQENIALWNARYSRLPHWGTATLLQGDSRQLAAIAGQAAGVVSSPPYESCLDRGVVDKDLRREWAREHGISNAEHVSPIDMDIHRLQGYGGASPGQLGAMRGGGYDAAVSSPPYDCHVVKARSSELEAGRIDGKNLVTSGSFGRTRGVLFGEKYGDTVGNLGNDTAFWPAARAIVDQVYQVLRPGGVAIWVLKAYVRNKQIVDFPGQWRQLCESAGFETLHEHKAWLVEERGTQHTLDNGTETKVVKRVSFFRRLAERKGSPAIDFEQVVCMRKPEVL
jgi:hypothetical protein